MVLGAIAIITAVSAIYFQLYKRHVNRAVKEGKRTAYDRMENAAPSQDNGGERWGQQTFYAEITEISGTLEDGNTVAVKGLSVNDINFRGEFSFSVFGETLLEWHNTPLDFSELEAGDIISVTYRGEIQKTSPAVINEVLRIQLLDDNK